MWSTERLWPCDDESSGLRNRIRTRTLPLPPGRLSAPFRALGGVALLPASMECCQSRRVAKATSRVVPARSQNPTATIVRVPGMVLTENKGQKASLDKY